MKDRSRNVNGRNDNISDKTHAKEYKAEAGSEEINDNKNYDDDDEYPMLSPEIEAFFRWTSIAMLTLCMIGMAVFGIKLYQRVNAKQAGNKTGAAHLKKITKQAERYYEEKYDKAAVVKENGYVRVLSMKEEALSDIYVVMEDGTTVIYMEETKQFADDGQAGVISDQITETVLVNLLREAAEQSGFKAVDLTVEAAEINAYGNGTNKAGHYFHAYYEGDIEKYLATETVTLSGVQLYVLCGKNEDWEVLMTALQGTMQDTFTGYSDSEISVCFLSEECYQKYLEGVYRKPDTGMDDCYACYVMGRKEEAYLQHYVKAAKGIYVTSAEPGLVLEEGDVVFEEMKEVTEKTVNERLLHNYELSLENSGEELQKQDEFYSQMIVRTPVYSLRYSDKIQAYMRQQDRTYHELAVYVKFVPEEAGIEKPLKQEIDDELVKLSEKTKDVRETLEKDREAGKEATDSQKRELWQRCWLYYFEETRDYRCKDLESDLSDAERMMAEPDDKRYFFGGYEILCKNAKNN